MGNSPYVKIRGKNVGTWMHPVHFDNLTPKNSGVKL